MSEHHDHDTDPHVHRAQEADEPQSIERVPRGMPSGRIDAAGGQAGLQDVDRNRDLGSRADRDRDLGSRVDRGGWSIDDQASAGAIGGNAGTQMPQGLAEGDTLGGTTELAEDPSLAEKATSPDSMEPADVPLDRGDVRRRD